MMRNIEEFNYGDYYVGQCFPEEIGAPDRVVFDVTDDGSLLFIIMQNPTAHEIKQISSKDKRIRMNCFGYVLWLTFKFGELEWFDAPYNPHLSKHVDFPRHIDFVCNDISIVLVDSSDGKVKYCTRLKYNDAFAASLKTGIAVSYGQVFDEKKYDDLLDFVRSKASPKLIAERSIVECVF